MRNMRTGIKSLLLVSLLFVISAAGCTTLADARNAKGRGRSNTYEAPFETVWAKAKIAVADTGLSVASENKEEGYILAQKGLSAFSYGENVAVFVQKVDDTHTKVEVVSKKALETNLFATNWEKPILDRVAQLLEKQ